MADEKKAALAQNVFDTLCAAIERREWSYNKDKLGENPIVHFKVNGDDIPMQFVIIVSVENQLIRVASPLPFKMSEDKRMEGALAACMATYGMADGSFDYDISDGSLSFRMTSSFRESLIGEDLFQYMISCSCAMVDKFNDRFLALSKGMIKIEDFIPKDD